MLGKKKNLNKKKDSNSFKNDGLSPIVNTYIHAVSDKYPKIRYTVGLDSRIYCLLGTFLPDFLLDFLVNFTLKRKNINKRNL